jgi:hypothetical protein
MTDAKRPSDVIESVFAGVVASAYSSLYGVAMLLRSPVRGSFRLAVRRALPSVSQSAPQTLLVITFCAVYSILVATTEELDVAGAVRQFVLTRSLEKSATVLIFKAICFAVALDVFARTLAYLVHVRDRQRRQKLTSVLLYSYSASLLYLLPVTVAGAIYVNWVAGRDSADFRLFTYLLSVVSLFALLPATEIVSLNCGPLRYPTLSRAAILFVMLVIFSLASLFSEITGRWVSKQRADPPVVRELRCGVGANGRLTALAIVYNRTDRPAVIDQEQRIQLTHVRSKTKTLVNARIVASSMGLGQPIYVVSPAEVAWLAVEATEDLPLSVFADAPCTLPNIKDEPLTAGQLVFTAEKRGLNEE